MIYLVSYDIKNDKKRTKVSKLLKLSGVRLQFSVFKCKFNKKELNETKQKINEIITNNDSVMFFNLCEICESKTIQLGTIFKEKEISVIDI